MEEGLFRRIPSWVRWRNRALVHLRGRSLPVFFSPLYRPPIAGLEAHVGMDPRRAEMVLTYLLDLGLVTKADVHAPRRAELAELALVHSERHLQALATPQELARIFAVTPGEIAVDHVLHTLRLAVGGSVAGLRLARSQGGAVLNLLGGFHHAGRDGGGGFSALNDVAVAVRAVRADGERGTIVILDLDAHPPDGTSDCLADDDGVFIGSISGAAWDWQERGRVDETVLPAGCGDAAYLAALKALLRRLPRPALALVLAGGDVLRGDRLGCLGLTLAGVADRDVAVARWLGDAPSLWLPAGGYHRDAWRALATTASVLALGRAEAPRAGYDPVRSRIDQIARSFDPRPPRDPDVWLEAEDFADLTGGVAPPFRLLGVYSAEMLELALFRYGVLSIIARLGYSAPRVEIGQHATGERFVLYAEAGAERHLLVEAILDRLQVDGDSFLYVNWLTLRHPRASFGPGRRALPGQEVPGLGMAKEAGELLAQMARRLGLAGVAFRPASLHVAFAARHDFRFAQPERQGAFEALMRDLGHVDLGTLSRAVAAGHVLCNDAPIAWSADLMVCWLDAARSPDGAVVQAAAGALRYRLDDASAAAQSA